MKDLMMLDKVIGTRHLDLIERVVHETEIPVTQFLPTHINRNSHLFEAAVSFAREGGCVDFTLSLIHI